MIFYGVQYNGWWSVGGLVVVTFGLENERRRAYCDLRVGKSRRVFPVILKILFSLLFISLTMAIHNPENRYHLFGYWANYVTTAALGPTRSV